MRVCREACVDSGGRMGDEVGVAGEKGSDAVRRANTCGRRNSRTGNEPDVEEEEVEAVVVGKKRSPNGQYVRH